MKARIKLVTLRAAAPHHAGVSDREADIMALMVHARDLDTPMDWLLRCRLNRTLSGGRQALEPGHGH